MPALEPQRERAQSFVVCFVIRASSFRSRFTGAIDADVFFANSTTYPFHHTSDKCQHFTSVARQKADGVAEVGIFPVLVE